MNIWSRLQRLKEADAYSRGIDPGRWYSPGLTNDITSDLERGKREDSKRRKILMEALYSVVEI